MTWRFRSPIYRVKQRKPVIVTIDVARWADPVEIGRQVVWELENGRVRRKRHPRPLRANWDAAFYFRPLSEGL